MPRAKIRHSGAWVTITDEDHRLASGAGTHKIDDLIQGDDNTDLNASVARHGLLPKLSGIPGEALKGDGTWGTVASEGGGGGGGVGSVLVVKQANVVADGNAIGGAGTTSATMVDVDATNLAVTFAVPPSGEVLVRLHGQLQKTTSGITKWGLREGSTTIASALVGSSTDTDYRPIATFLITGLTPNQIKTWKWAFSTTAGTTYVVGGPTYGPAVMTVQEANGLAPGELMDPQPGTSTYDSTVLAHSALTNYWKLDEGGGTTAADSKGSFPGTVVTAAHVVMGVEGTTFDGRACAYFTGGTGARISMGTTLNVPTGAYSLEIWMQGEDGHLENTSLLGRWGTANGAMLFLTAGGIHLHVTAQSTCQWTPGWPWFTDGLWHHIVGTFDGSIARLYVDGALRSATAYVATGAPTGTVPFEIGAYGNGSSAEYGGYVAAAALYNAAISDADVLDHYERGVGDAWVGGPAVNQGIDALLDVDTSTTPPDDGQALLWDDDLGLWLPRSIAAAATGSLSVTRISRSTDQNVTGSGTATAVSFDTEDRDDAGTWAIGTPTKIVVPAALNGREAVLIGQLRWTGSSAGNYRSLRIRRNGAATHLGITQVAPTGTTVSIYQQVMTQVVTLATGDEFELMMQADTTGIGLLGGNNFLELRTIEHRRGLTIPNLLNSIKASADTPDDEFELTTLAGKWTAVGGTVGTVDLMRTTIQNVYDLTTRPGWLLIQGAVSLRQDFTLPDNTSYILPAHATPAPGGDNLSIGIYLNTDDAAPQTGPSIQFYLEQDTTTWDAQVTVVSTATGGATLNRSHESPQIVFIRVARSGTTYAMFISGDGYSWAYVGAGVSATLLTNLWIVSGAESTFARLPIIAIPWARQGSNALDPWPIT